MTPEQRAIACRIAMSMRLPVDDLLIAGSGSRRRMRARSRFAFALTNELRMTAAEAGELLGIKAGSVRSVLSRHVRQTNCRKLFAPPPVSEVRDIWPALELAARAPVGRGKAIVRAVTDRYGVTVDEILQHRREAAITHAAQACAWWLLRLTSLSTTQCAALLGRDHTTIIHGERAHGARCGVGPARPSRLAEAA